MIGLAFTGDIAFSKYFQDAWRDSELVAPELIDFLRSAAYVVPNVEGPLTNNRMVRGDSATPAHASDPRAADWLCRLNGTVWNLSNNHVLDCGETGLRDTVELAESRGCRVFGAGKSITEAATPVMLEEGGGIGLLAVCYKKQFEAGKDRAGVIHWQDDKRIKQTIRQIKKSNRWCILVVHGGEEFSHLPMPYVRRQYLRYLRYGADFVVGHHPHVPQNYECVGRKMVFYSLGNFIFDTDYQRLQQHTDQGVLLKLNLSADTYNWEYMPYQIDREKACVKVGACPVVFRNLSAKEYRRISPLAVKSFLVNNRRAKSSLSPKISSYSSIQWAKWYVKKKGCLASLSLWNGCIRYRLGGWKKGEKSLIEYICQ